MIIGHYSLRFMTVVILQAALAAGLTGLSARGDEPAPAAKDESQQELPVKLKNNPLSEINLLSGKAVLDVDPFGDPSAMKISVEYKNVGRKPVDAVQFRIRFFNKGKGETASFRGVDTVSLPPGGVGAQKWRYAGTHRKVERLGVEVVKVKYADGTIWDPAAKDPEFPGAIWD